MRWNLTASGPGLNPQGSYHYGMIKPSSTIILSNSAPWINGKQRYAVNGVSFVVGDTPLKLADYFNIGGLYNLGSISEKTSNGNAYLSTSVVHADFRSFAEIVFQNWEDTVQSWHIDGYSFFVVGMDGGQWTQASRSRYNLRDTVTRSTIQVYPMVSDLYRIRQCWYDTESRVNTFRSKYFGGMHEISDRIKPSKLNR